MHLTFKINNRLIEMVSSCRMAESHRQTWGSDEHGPALWLVKDHGIYLMSNEAFPETDPRESLPVVYAEECNPHNMSFDDWWAAGMKILGGDDSVTPIKLDLFEFLISKGKKHVRFEVDPKTGTLRVVV